MLILVCLVLSGVELASAGMLVAEGTRSHYVANQEEGIVFVVYGNGEWVRFADGFGSICGLAAGPDNSVYVLSRTQKRLFRVNVDGTVRAVKKFSEVPDAVLVDRDGEVKFVQRSGVLERLK